MGTLQNIYLFFSIKFFKFKGFTSDLKIFLNIMIVIGPSQIMPWMTFSLRKINVIIKKIVNFFFYYY